MKHKIGVIGCGVISEIYFSNIKNLFDNIEVAACADMVPEKAKSRAEEFGIPKYCSVEELLSDKEIEIILNLTVPAAHAEINKMALQNGKHVYCEKPLALSASEAQETLALAKNRNLFVCCAPDTFLGAGIQTCRRIIDSGIIGKVVFATANMVNHGPEMWHSSPEFYYKTGGGPLFDMGPYYLTALVSLLGAVKSTACIAETAEKERMIYSKPKKGTLMPVEVYTGYSGILSFDGGAVANINMSFDVWRSSLPKLEIYGTEGTLIVPDPNFFGGKVKIFRKKSLLENQAKVPAGNDDIGNEAFYEEIPHCFQMPSDNMRGVGLCDMARAIDENRKPRAGSELAFHVTEIMLGMEKSAKDKTSYSMLSSCERPQAFSL